MHLLLGGPLGVAPRWQGLDGAVAAFELFLVQSLEAKFKRKLGNTMTGEHWFAKFTVPLPWPCLAGSSLSLSVGWLVGEFVCEPL